MTKKKILAVVDIRTDEKYCDENCRHFKAALSIAVPAQCALFGKPCEHCLGGGPLRCEECLKAKEIL